MLISRLKTCVKSEGGALLLCLPRYVGLGGNTSKQNNLLRCTETAEYGAGFVKLKLPPQ